MSRDSRELMHESRLCLETLENLCTSRELPGTMAPCLWYDVFRVEWPAHKAEPRADVRLGSIHPTNSTFRNCRGYGADETEDGKSAPSCKRCPGDAFGDKTFHVQQCAKKPLLPFNQSLTNAPSSSTLPILLVTSDHNNHGLFAQVERVLNQLYYAETRGLTPYIYLGQRVFNSHDSCDQGFNQYYEESRGDNVWEYYFDQVSDYRLGDPEWKGRPVRLLVASENDVRRYMITKAGDAVTSYFAFKEYNDAWHNIRLRVRAIAYQLLSRWVRIKPELRQRAGKLIREWRMQSNYLIGVHLRGTDKAVHPKVPLERYTRYVDAYMNHHPGALVVLATDDRRFYEEFSKRYGSRMVSGSKGYPTRNIVRDTHIDRYSKGADAIVDALLLAHTDFLLKSTSAVSEFAIWYNPFLSTAHLDLQIEGAGVESLTYKRLIPTWADGTYEVRKMPVSRMENMIDDLFDETPASIGKYARVRRRRKMRRNGRMENGLSNRQRHRTRRRKYNPNGSNQRLFDFPPNVTRFDREDVEKEPAVRHGPMFTLIKGGKCTDVLGRRAMTQVECQSYANGEKMQYIGTSDDNSEPQGCAIYDNQHVEFNRNPGFDQCPHRENGQCICYQP